MKNAAEGEDVHLRIHDKPPDATRLVWYRGDVLDNNCIIAFLAQTANYHMRGPPNGQVTINYDGSLLLKKVTMKDSGIYTIAVEQQDSKILIGYAQLNVHRE